MEQYGVRWQLPEPGALMSAKAYRDKKALPLLEKLKELVKNLTIKSVQLAETVKRLTDRVDTLESARQNRGAGGERNEF